MSASPCLRWSVRGGPGRAFRARQRRANQAIRAAGRAPLDSAAHAMLDALPAPQREALIAYLERLARVPWFERVGLPHPRDGEIARVTLREARARRWPHVLSFPGASESHDRAMALSLPEERERIYDEMPDVVGDLVASHADALCLHVRWDVAKEVAQTAIQAAWEIALSDLIEERYFEPLLAWYEDGHWPCGFEEGGRLVVL